MLALIVAFIGVVVVTWALMWELRRATFDEAREEVRLKDPRTGALSYVVPDGQDPAVLAAALAGAGFHSLGILQHGVERLLIDCPTDGERDRVRSIIEHVRRTGFAGDEIVVSHVRFDDELPA
jgi:hypothetical protein